MITVNMSNDDLRYEITNIIRMFYKNSPIKYVLCKASEEIAISESGEDFRIELFIDSAKKDDILTRLFISLRNMTGINPPYGKLTGVRPAKICSEMSRNGFTDIQILNRLHDEYFVNEEKADLMLEVSKLEKKIINSFESDDISVYIGIPFCPSKCKYCSFTSYPIVKFNDTVDRYIDAICSEMDYINRNLISSKKNVRTIYIGGGTPTSLNNDQLKKLLERTAEIFDLSKVYEYTVEAGRPDTLDDTKLKIMKDSGVERISINPQTMNDDTLKLIGRAHTRSDVYRAFDSARRVGFSNINMDVIVGLPKEDAYIFEDTMSRIAKLDPESITVHSLAIKRASDFKTDFHSEKFSSELPKDDEVMKMSGISVQYARLMNMRPYYMYRQKNISGNLENTGYSKTGYECAYNVLIMEEIQSILAFGAGGVSKFIYPEQNRIERAFNVKDPLLYIRRLDEMCDRKMKFSELF